MYRFALRNVDYLTLDVSFSRTDVFKNSFFVLICRLWNELTLSIRESRKVNISESSGGASATCLLKSCFKSHYVTCPSVVQIGTDVLMRAQL